MIARVFLVMAMAISLSACITDSEEDELVDNLPIRIFQLNDGSLVAALDRGGSRTTEMLWHRRPGGAWVGLEGWRHEYFEARLGSARQVRTTTRRDFERERQVPVEQDRDKGGGGSSH